MKCHKLCLTLLLSARCLAQPVEVVKVRGERVDRKIQLPGELRPYQQVDLHARVTAVVDRVLVDRGSAVRKGQLLVALSAPEMDAQIAEAESRVQTIEAQRAEAEAKASGAQSTYDRLKATSATPGAIAGNELIQAEKALEAARAARELSSSIRSAKAAVEALRDVQKYLSVTAPFDGVITERFVHPGALAGPATGPLLRLEQTARLRLVVSLPESEAGAIARGAKVAFTVPAFPGRTFHGTTARNPRSLEPKTRTMPIELDVINTGGALAPSMYADVNWPVRSTRTSLLVPKTSVVTNTERSFVIRVTRGTAEWVGVKRRASSGEYVEVLGALKEGDHVVKRGSDELCEGTKLQARIVS